MIDELLEIRGDKDFRDTIERFVLRMTSGRQIEARTLRGL